MVRKLHLTTRCGSTMAAGMALSGLLHGRRHTPTPSIIPPRTPKATTCPWMTVALSESNQPSSKPTYSAVLRAPPPRHNSHTQLIRRRPPNILSAPIQWITSHFRRLRRGTWRWQSLAHHLDLLLPLPPTSSSNNHTPTIHHDFDPITQWLPTLYTSPSSHDDFTHSTDALSFSHGDALDDITLDNSTDNDDDNTPSPPISTNNPPHHALSIACPNIQYTPPPTTMDISKIYTQNVHGLWCRARDSNGNIINNYECDTTKLEHLIHRMRTDDIDAWLVQETWSEEDDFDTVIGGYHIFRHNSPIDSTGRNHLFRGVAIVLSPRYYLAWRAAGSPSPITTASTGEFAGRFIGLNLKFDCFDSHGR